MGEEGLIPLFVLHAGECDRRKCTALKLAHFGKASIVRLGTRLGVPYALTLTCYDPVRGRACGRCDACTLRRQGFEAAGIPDPTRYHRSRKEK